MIRSIKIRNFKSFHDNKFQFQEIVVLAGPNNAGKSTLLQALSTWNFGVEKWVTHRRANGRSKAIKKSAVSVSRNDFTPVPLREMNLLWENRLVSGGKPRKRRYIEIIVEGKTNDREWSCGLELQYASPEVVYIRPLNVKSFTAEEYLSFPPDEASKIDIVHVPALSGINRDEPRLDLGMQNQLVGQGRPGEVVRNLLLQIAERNNGEWENLCAHLQELFQIELQRPSYSPLQPFIVCEYRVDKGRPLDLSNAGTGALQIILLLAFLYARPATVLLLDEPDAHQHKILQKQVYELMRKVAREREGQLILATHSEVILDETHPGHVISFSSNPPQPIISLSDRDRLRESLKRISTTDVLSGKHKKAVLYVEGQTDESILRAWSRVLDHPAREFFDDPYVHLLRGRNLRGAKEHYFAIKAAIPDIQAICLLDGDNREELDTEETDDGLSILRWNRYEIENYLLQPTAINRFINFPLLTDKVNEEFGKEIPPGADLFGDHVSLVRVKASNELLIPLFQKLRISITKQDLFQLAECMLPEEIHPEVIDKLDRIANKFNL